MVEKKSRAKTKAKSPTVNLAAPFGWYLAGTRPFDYEAPLDTKVFHSGTRSCCVRSVVDKASGWTTLMQNMGPAPYLGKRLRMRLWVRTEDVGYVSCWMRVDGGPQNDTVEFDNMCNRKLVGTNDWALQEIVLDIPDESKNIGFGVILSGQGVMWVDDISFEMVDSSVPVTECACSPRKRDIPPQNLNFESNDPDYE